MGFGGGLGGFDRSFATSGFPGSGFQKPVKKGGGGGVEGLFELDEIGKFTSVNNMAYGSRMKGWQGPWTGIGKASPTGLGWNGACRSVAEITAEVGGVAYVQWGRDSASTTALGYATTWDIMVGLGYVDDDNCAGATPYDWCTWQWWLTAGGTNAYCGPCPGVEFADVYQNWTNGAEANAVNNRTCRLEVNAGEVSWKYSDNNGSSWTTMYTSPRVVDIAGNSNLVASVTVNSPHGYAATPENLKIYGNLINT